MIPLSSKELITPFLRGLLASLEPHWWSTLYATNVAWTRTARAAKKGKSITYFYFRIIVKSRNVELHFEIWREKSRIFACALEVNLQSGSGITQDFFTSNHKVQFYIQQIKETEIAKAATAWGINLNGILVFHRI